MNVEDIVVEWLRQNGYDGIYSDECGCAIEDFAPCGEMCLDGAPGHKVPCDCENGCDYHIVPKKRGLPKPDTERETLDKMRSRMRHYYGKPGDPVGYVSPETWSEFVTHAGIGFSAETAFREHLKKNEIDIDSLTSFELYTKWVEYEDV